MAVRLNLETRFVLLLAGGMTLILVLSTYLYDISTAALIEDDRYNTAISQTVAIADRIADLQLLRDPDALQRDIAAVSNEKRDFEQIDVYQQQEEGQFLVATTAPAAERLPALDERAVDNELQEMERPLPGVVTMEVQRGGVRYWVITVRNRGESSFVTTLLPKTGFNPFVRRRELRDSLLLGGTIAICVGLFWVLFARFFRRPARNLALAMRRAREGTFPERATVDRNDELGDIARGFNLLMDDLAARDREREALLAEIRGFNSRLRGEVDRAVAELRTRNDELYQSQQKLGRAERLAAMGQLAAGLAHEIGTPLNSVSGHLQLLARRHSEDDQTKRRLDIVNQQIALIVQSVRALLRRTQKRRLVMRPTDLNALIREVVRLAEPTLDAHGIVASVELSDSLPTVQADRDSLHEVLLNLLNNSVDAMPRGGRLSLRTGVAAEGHDAMIEVSDTGIGIRPEQREHLFEPTWTTKPMGSGFGLAIAREIVDAHGGTIQVESEFGAGATFVLRVPLPATIATS